MKTLRHRLAMGQRIHIVILAIATAIAAILPTAVAQAAGIPVIDAANLGQAIAQVSAWQQQYAQMQSQIMQLQSAYASTTGDRGMGRLLAGNRTYLPADWTSAMTTLNQNGGTRYSALAQAAQQIQSAQAVLTPQQIATMTPQFQQYLSQIRQLSAAQQAIGQAAYNTAAQRVGLLQTLTSALNGQSDPKAILDLQARIQSEQAGLANDQAQLQAVAQLTVAQDQAQQHMVNELRVQTSGSGTFPALDTSIPF